MAGIDSLTTLLQEELKDIYDAEKQLTRALPKMAKKATAQELKDAFQEHLQQTEQHIERLEQVFETLELPVRGKKCKGMQNLIQEGEEMIREAEDDATRDALMIAAAQKVEHYEIAAYGTMRVWASVLGQTEVSGIFEETLDEEKETDQKLTQIAESFVNQASADESDEDEEMGRAAQTRAGRGGSARTRQQAADRSGRGSKARSSSGKSANTRSSSRSRSRSR